MCDATDSCFRKTYNVDLITGGGKQNLDFGYCGDTPFPKSEPNALPGPCGGLPVCGSVCAGQCVPGEPPYKYDASCNKVDACSQCGCPPSAYPGATVSCLGTGLCGYAAPPGLPGEPPDCPTSVPDGTYTKTYDIKTLYLLSGDNTGSFSGYKYSGSWQTDANIKSGLSAASYASPAVFFDNSDTYLITGKGDGTFAGYNWTGSGWSSLPAIVSGLPDIGDNSKPAIFYKDGSWNMLAGNKTGNYSGFTFTGSNWVSNASLVAGLPNQTCNAAPSVFYSGAMYLIAGNCSGGFSGYYWNGTEWLADDYITSGLLNVAANSAPYAFYNNSKLYLITGKGNGQFSGYDWNGTQWLADASIIAGLSAAGSQSSPAVFSIDSTYTKTFTYSTRFPLESMLEYPSAGSDCFQNKTTLTIPEGHACLVDIYANSTTGWGVRLKTTTAPGTKLVQDPYNVCGYINESLYSSCTPTGFGGTQICPVNQTPVLQAGSYEFGIVSSTGVANNKVSKACGYITQCADCQNPYAQYYCNLCTNNICNDNIQDCGETGVDCGGPCQTGKETDNNYYPALSYTDDSGLSNTILYTDTVGGLNCVDGIDNDHDCKTDCADSACAGSLVCSIDIDPPVTSLTLDPPTPNAKGWFTTTVKATLRCEDTQSGCASTVYRIDGGNWTTISYAQPSFILSTDGVHLLEYYSTDKRENVESTKSSTIKIYISPPLSLMVNPPRVIVPLGAQGQGLITIKNLLDRPDTITLSITGMPTKLHRWLWFGGHRDDNSKYQLTVQLQSGEEKIVPMVIFGGEVLSGGMINVTAESSYIGVIRSGVTYVDIAHSDDGLTVQTPEFGWVGYVLIALAGAFFIAI
ncbi:Uncharacterised protein [uncultured archaeon]|nr:Uncharacterised protein [uncultured archaeon]